MNCTTSCQFSHVSLLLLGLFLVQSLDVVVAPPPTTSTTTDAPTTTTTSQPPTTTTGTTALPITTSSTTTTTAASTASTSTTATTTTTSSTLTSSSAATPTPSPVLHQIRMTFNGSINVSTIHTALISALVAAVPGLSPLAVSFVNIVIPALPLTQYDVLLAINTTINSTAANLLFQQATQRAPSFLLQLAVRGFVLLVAVDLAPTSPPSTLPPATTAALGSNNGNGPLSGGYEGGIIGSVVASAIIVSVVFYLIRKRNNEELRVRGHSAHMVVTPP